MTALALVVAQFYEDVATEMETRAVDRAAERDATVAETVRAPEVYDTTLAADRLARREDVDAVAVRGAVVTGDTDHDQVITHETARALSRVSLDRDTPVGFGLVGPDMSAAEAHERIEKGAGAVDAVLDTLEALPDG